MKHHRRHRIKNPHVEDKLSYQMQQLLQRASGADMTFGEVVQSFGKRSHAILMVFLSFPLCSPVGIPVLTSSLGVALALVCLFLALNRPPWMPRRLRDKVIQHDKLVHITQRLLRMINAIEHLLHPRLLALASNGPVVRFHGAYTMVLALMAATPLTLPLNNLIPAFPILLIGLALLERDGLLIILAYVVSIFSFAYFGGIIYVIREIIERLIG